MWPFLLTFVCHLSYVVLLAFWFLTLLLSWFVSEVISSLFFLSK
jgi:hypothetical protein